MERDAIQKNDIFKHFLEMTQLNEDHKTLIQLFSEQGLSINSEKIYAWSKPLSDPQSRCMPTIMFFGFMNLLQAINLEAMSKGINLFDLREILPDIRENKGLLIQS